MIKSTQNGITEYLIVRAIGHAIKGLRVFYVLPTFELLKRCVDERYQKSTQNTRYYRALVKAAKEEMDIKQTESVRSKDIGIGNIAFVNSFSSIGFTEYPADEVIIDELDKCDQTNILMAEERIAHSDYRWQTKISNPTFKGMGIDEEYDATDQMEWFSRCGGHWVKMDWFQHVVREIDEGRYIIRDKEYKRNSGNDINPICDKCGKPIDRMGPGQWVPKFPERLKRGYRLTKLFTGTVPILSLLDRFQKGLSNDDIMQRFYNADLGSAYTAKGSKLDREMILNCVRDYRIGPDQGLIVAGIDVGKVYNVIIKNILPGGILKTIFIGEIQDTIDLIGLLKKYKMNAGVIDGMPETRESKKISKAFPLMFLCYYGSSKNDSIDFLGKSITVQRTSALDAVKEGVLTGAIQYPININSDEKFIGQMTASVRVFNKDKRVSGQKGAYEWVEGNLPDHYFHASAYALIARRLIALINHGKK